MSLPPASSSSTSSPIPSSSSPAQAPSETSPSMSSSSTPNTPTMNPPTSTSTSSISTTTTSTTSSPTSSPSPSSTETPSSTTSPPPSTSTSLSSEPVNPSPSSLTTSLATSNSLNPIPSSFHDTTAIHTETPTVTPMVSVTVTSLATIPTSLVPTHSTDGRIVTQTSIVPSPSLSPNDAASRGTKFLANRGAIAAVCVVVVLAVCTFILLGVFVYRRRRKQRKMETDVTTAAMAAVGVHRIGGMSRAPPFDDDDPLPPPMAQQQRTFEDGTLFTSALDQDVERDAGDFDPYNRDAFVGSRSGALPAGNTARSASPPPLTHAPSSSLGHGYGEHANRSSSHGHDTSHSGHEPLIPSRSRSRSQSPPAHAMLSGSFQRQRSFQRGSSVETHIPAVPPVPQHILTSFAAPDSRLVNRDEDVTSALSVYSQSDGGDEGGLSPLDPDLSSRLRDGNDSGGTVGLRDHEDYSLRPKLEIRNRTGSQRTFGTLE